MKSLVDYFKHRILRGGKLYSVGFVGFGEATFRVIAIIALPALIIYFVYPYINGVPAPKECRKALNISTEIVNYYKSQDTTDTNIVVKLNEAIQRYDSLAQKIIGFSRVTKKEATKCIQLEKALIEELGQLKR